MQAVHKQLVLNVDASANQTSAVILNEIAFQGSIQYVFTGSPVGNLFAEVSNDFSPDKTGVGVVNWTAYPTSGTVAISASGNGIISMPTFAYKWLRLRYAVTSGAGTLSAVAFLQGP